MSVPATSIVIATGVPPIATPTGVPPIAIATPATIPNVPLTLKQLAESAAKYSKQCDSVYKIADMTVQIDVKEAEILTAEMRDSARLCERLCSAQHRALVSHGKLKAQHVMMSRRHLYNRRVLAGYTDTDTDTNTHTNTNKTIRLENRVRRYNNAASAAWQHYAQAAINTGYYNTIQRP